MDPLNEWFTMRIFPYRIRGAKLFWSSVFVTKYKQWWFSRRKPLGHGSLSFRPKIFTRAFLPLVGSEITEPLLADVWQITVTWSKTGVNVVKRWHLEASCHANPEERNEDDKYWINLYYLKYVQDNTGINSNEWWTHKLEISNSIFYLDRSSDCICLLDCNILTLNISSLNIHWWNFLLISFSTKVRVQFAMNHFQL